MKHRTWFRLALKAIGILLIGLSINQVFYIGGMVYGAVVLGDEFWFGVPFSSAGMTIPAKVIWTILTLLQMLSPMLIGLYLLLGGKWLVNMVIPLDRSYCDQCGFDRSISQGKHCPECGATVQSDETRSSSAAPSSQHADADRSGGSS